MNMQQRHVFGEIAAQGDAVIHVHKFRRNEPDRKPLLFHPVVAQQQKVAVQPCKAADIEMQRARKLSLQAVLFRCGQVVMADVLGGGEHQIIAVLGWMLLCEIPVDNVESLAFP